MISALSTLKTIFFTIPNPILNANSYQGLFVYFTFKGLYEILTCFFFLKSKSWLVLGNCPSKSICLNQQQYI